MYRALNWHNTVNGGSCKRHFQENVANWKKNDIKDRWVSGAAGEYEEYDQIYQELVDLYSAYLTDHNENKEIKEEEKKKLVEDEKHALEFRKNAALKWGDKTNMEDPKNVKNKNRKRSAANSDIIDLQSLENVKRDKLDLHRKRFKLDETRLALEERRVDMEEKRVEVELLREENKAKEMELMKEMFRKSISK
eukprot:NODE_999_length_2750_cov_0.286307.p2 type:complete len:193 gc:universal NODE_999_length_2750_cov_0.286307:1441-2019(+)